MKRLSSFIIGMAVGAGLLFGALHYHVVRAKDGMHLVPKVDAKIAATYVDIRGFGVSDWAERPDLAAALIEANRRDLMEEAAADALRTGLDRFLGSDAPPSR